MDMKKRIRLKYNSPVILTFVLLCLAVTWLGLATKDLSTTLFFSVYRGSFSDPLSYIRMVTHVFGHSGLEHFMGNAMYLLLLGPMLEEKHGSKAMLKVIAVTAVVTGLIHCLFWGGYALCGASGVVFACILLSSFTAFKEGEIPVTFIMVAILFIGQEILSGILIEDNVSNLTHIIGGLVGSACGYKLNRK